MLLPHVAKIAAPVVRRPNHIELADGTRIPILYEDRSVLALDKPAGWMLVPYSWQKTDRNLQAALVSSIHAGQFWARARNLKFLRYVHRLDAETTGALLLAKSPGALDAFHTLFESRKMEKVYLVVVHGKPEKTRWTCRLKLAPDPRTIGRMRVEEHGGKEAETHFELLQGGGERSLLAARPVTGRTHQIRVHLSASGNPVVGDGLYGAGGATSRELRRSAAKPSMGLRATSLCYTDPFTRRRVQIQAPVEAFLRKFGFGSSG